MTLKLSHIAIAVPEMQEVCQRLAELGLSLEKTHEVPSEKVKVGMIESPVSSDFRIELLEPLSDDSPITRFLQKRTRGGMHHICFEVDDVQWWHDRLKEKGIEVLAPGVRKAARGKALFIHPNFMAGVLVELEQLEETT